MLGFSVLLLCLQPHSFAEELKSEEEKTRRKFLMSVISMKQLLEAGVHFGHPTRKWNPKMKKYIFTSRNDIYILNLEQTVGLIDEAYAFVKSLVEEGKTILFVGTKKQAKDAIIEEAQRCGMYYVGSRWLGGTLTNFKTIRNRVERLNKLNLMEKSGEFDLLPKKEVLKLKAERDKLNENLGGIKDMKNLPGCMFVVDPKKENIAVREARSLNIPIVGLVDTNCDPDDVDFVIPGNDDAIRAVKLIAGAIADAVIEARDGEEGLAKMKEEMAAKEAENAQLKQSDEEIVKEDVVSEEIKVSVEDKVSAPVKKTARKAEVVESDQKDSEKKVVKNEKAPSKKPSKPTTEESVSDSKKKSTDKK